MMVSSEVQIQNLLSAGESRPSASFSSKLEKGKRAWKHFTIDEVIDQTHKPNPELSPLLMILRQKNEVSERS
jgi:hypothetical protein